MNQNSIDMKYLDSIIEFTDILNTKDLSTIKEYCKIAKFKGGSTDINNFWYNRVENFKEMPKEIIEILNNIFINIKPLVEKKYKIKLKEKEPTTNLTIWRPAMGMHSHIDDADYKHYNIAALFYINDNYSGGELYFKNFNHLVKPKENSLIIFPGNEIFEHEVKVVIRGFRYTSNHWFEFEKEE